MRQIGGLLACVVCLRIRSLHLIEQSLASPTQSCEGHDVTMPPAQRRCIRAAMLANLRQVAAADAACTIAEGTLGAEADMPAVREAVLLSAPAIILGESCWLSSPNQARLPSSLPQDVLCWAAWPR